MNISKAISRSCPNFRRRQRQGRARPRVRTSPRPGQGRFRPAVQGFVRVPQTGVYVFYVNSDDGTKLTVAGKDIVLNDGVHGMTEEKAEIALAAGWHPFELVYFQGTGDMGLVLSWRGPGFPKSFVPASFFGR